MSDSVGISNFEIERIIKNSNNNNLINVLFVFSFLIK